MSKHTVVELFGFAVTAKEDIAVFAGVAVEEFEGGGSHGFKCFIDSFIGREEM